MPFITPFLAVIPDLFTAALSTVLTVVVAFFVITLISSYFRFQHIVELAENTQPEEMGSTREDIIRIQMARYLASCARKNSSFAFSLIRTDNPTFKLQMGGTFVHALKGVLRQNDIVCVFDDQTAALFTELEAEDSVSVLQRIVHSTKPICEELEITPLSVGIAVYPGHGLSGKVLLNVAQQGLRECTADQRIVLPEIISHDEDEAEDPQVNVEVVHARKEKRHRKDKTLDELTGVLKPLVVSSYMQRQLSEIRRRKLQATLFCVGVNNVDHIARFHGTAAADDVLISVSNVLKRHLRADDLIGRHEKYAFLILTISTREEAELIGKRLSTLVQQAEIKSGHTKLKTSIMVASASHPEDGRNLHMLYSAAQKVLDYNRENDIRAYAVYNPEIHDTMPSKPMKSIKATQA